MTPHDIEALARVLQQHGIAACEVHDGGSGARVKLRLHTRVPPTPAPPAEPRAAVATAHASEVVRSPGMGRFMARHPLQDSPAAMPGQQIEAGQTVGYLRAGALIDAITAPQAAILGRQLVEEGELLGYGDAVFELS